MFCEKKQCYLHFIFNKHSVFLVLILQNTVYSPKFKEIYRVFYMGFERTSEGRIFFSGAKTAEKARAQDDNALRSPLTGRVLQQEIKTKPYSNAHNQILPNSLETSDNENGSMQSQYQVLSLLKNLNEKLKLTQVERNSMRQELKSYRQMISSLEQKATQQETAFQNLQSKVQSDKPASDSDQDISAALNESRRMYEKLENRTERTDRSLNDLLEKAQSHRDISVSLSQKQTELERLQKQLEKDRAQYQENYKDIKSRLEQTEDTQSIMKMQLSTSLENNQKIHVLIEEDRNDRDRFMRKLDRLENSLVNITQNQPLLGSDKSTPLPTAKDPDAKQGEGIHIPHYLVHKVAEQDVQNTADKPLSEFINKILSANVNISTTALISGTVVLLGAGWFISQAQIPNIKSLVQQVNSSSPQSTVEITPITQPDWSISESVNEFIPLEAEAINSPAIHNENLPNKQQVETIHDVMDTAPDMAAEILNQIEPGTKPEKAPALKISSNIPTLQAAPSAIDAPNPLLPIEYQELETMAFDGVHDAQHDIAALYIVGKNGVAQDYTRAAYWFDKAAQGGIANATYNMGVLYQQGLGVKQDIAQAVRWYISAADQGHGEAAYNLGISYIEGIGVEYNPYKAALHFEQAASAGIKEAAYNLGLIYENSLLGSAKPREALMWYKIAADQGLPEAQNALGQLVKASGIQYNEIEQLVSETKKQYPAISPLKNQEAEKTSQAISAQTTDISSQTNLLKHVQQKLVDLKLYPGPVDGKTGPLTSDAVRSYQKSYDLPITGKITPALYQHMAQ